MNITLIGMPGSGKSFIGKRLADAVGYKLIEIDLILEREYNLPLREILGKLGDEVFLEKQARAIILHTDNQDGLVISPGGSIVYTDSAMEHLRQISKIVYLRTSLITIQGRIAEVPRGIVGSKGKTLQDLYKERAALYEKWADFSIDADKNAEEIIAEILKAIHK